MCRYWAKQKIVRLEKYFYAFATSMHDKWDSLNYIEIASGPGICLDRKSLYEFDGSALAYRKKKLLKSARI